MARGRKEQIESIINALNAIHVGELSGIEHKVKVAGGEIEGLGETELAASLEDARAALQKADLVNFRRLVAQTVARLGHLK